MSWTKKLFKAAATQTPQPVDLQSDQLLKWLGIERQDQRPINECTYYTCLKMLGETLAKLPLKLYRDGPNGIEKAEPNSAYKLLRIRPNPIMTPTIFWSSVENNRNHYGNAYVWIQREFTRKKYGGEMEVKGFWIMPSKNVQVLIDDQGFFGNVGALWYVYSDDYTHRQYVFSQDEVLHFKTSMSFDGIMGLPVTEILKMTIDGALAGQQYITNSYKEGMTAKMAMEYVGELSDKTVGSVLESIGKKSYGPKNAGKIFDIPPGFSLKPVEAKLTDSQFFELRKYTALQIAGAFGIKPNQINDYEKSSYSNSEMQQLSFYVDTELFILKQYEEELTYKTLTMPEMEGNTYYKFNEKAILRTDSETQARILTSYVNNAVYKPNEARDTLDMPIAPGADVLMANGNYIPLTDVGKQYNKGGTNEVKTE